MSPTDGGNRPSGAQPEVAQPEVSEQQLARARPPEITTEKSFVYRFARAAWKLWFLLVHRLRVEDIKKLPAEGGCLIVANHGSFLDIPLIAASTRRHVCFVARDTLAKSRVVGFMIRHTGAVMIRRGTVDRAALRDIVEHLKRGDCVAMFPEGTRTKDGRVGPFLRGMTIVARQARVPLVPCGIRGTFDILPPGKSVPRPVRCSIRYGAPIEVDRADPDASLERARQEVLAMVGQAPDPSPPAPSPPG